MERGTLTEGSEMKRRYRELQAQWPSQILPTKVDINSCTSEVRLWTMIVGRLDNLPISFLLERLSAERGNGNRQELLDTANEMLELTVYVWVQRDRLRTYQHDYDYMVS